VELSEFDIYYEPRGPIKGKVYAYFLVELVSKGTHSDLGDFQWILSVAGPPTSRERKSAKVGDTGDSEVSASSRRQSPKGRPSRDLGDRA